MDKNLKRTVTVAGLAFDGDKVLLVKHGEAAHHLTGIYGLPGGRLEFGEELLDGAAREFQEETGLIPDKSSMLKIPTVFEAEIDRKGGELLKTFWHVYLVRRYSGTLISSDETIPEWVPLSSVKHLHLLANTLQAIQEGQELSSR